MAMGIFTISLDFELYWGVRDKRSMVDYRANLEGVWDALPAMLDAFALHGVQATWAAVGFLFCESYEDLIENLPKDTQLYTDKRFCPVTYIREHAQDIIDNPRLHFARPLIERIKTYEGQEIGTHTLSHYYCLEHGQDAGDFGRDLGLSLALSKQAGVEATALVFPRNQFNDEYLGVCKKAGILAYRGNQPSALYEARNESGESRARRALRLMDAYVNIAGNHVHDPAALKSDYPVNVPASAFLRPRSKRLTALEPLRLGRIKSSMTHAARTGGLYHLWWHPHNFGANTAANMRALTDILAHFSRLRHEHGFTSMNMTGAARHISGL